jgi:hypothetical protein
LEPIIKLLLLIIIIVMTMGLECKRGIWGKESAGVGEGTEGVKRIKICVNNSMLKTTKHSLKRGGERSCEGI